MSQRPDVPAPSAGLAEGTVGAAEASSASSPPGPETKDAAQPAAHTSARPPSISTPPSAPLRDLVGEACGLALATALLGSVPAALRVAREGGSTLGGWLASAAVVIPLLAFFMYLSRAAGRGYRLLTGRGAGRSTAFGLVLWMGLLAPVLLVFASVLKEKTNHRGLGGATFGVTSLCVAIGAALVARRLMETGRRLVDRGVSPRIVAAGFAALSLGPLLVVAFPLIHDGGSPQGGLVAAALIDVVIFAIASAVAVTFDLGEELRARARRFGVAAAGAVVIVGFGWLSMSQSLGAALRSGGGLAAAMVGGLERWTDRDKDGVGAYFGGRDCDEGDPRRHPGAHDVPGDGIDQDCDGADGKGGEPVAEREPPPGPEAAGSPRVAAPPTQPSIVLVTLDTVRADATSLYGYDEKTTPELERLAERGTVFAMAYAPGSDTQRATMPLFSGRLLEDSARTRGEWPALKPEADTLAERLKAAGYVTAAVSSFQWISKDKGFDQGFDHFAQVFEDEHPERGITGPLAVRAARAILQKTAADGRPLFLWVQLFDAHAEHKRHKGASFGKGKRGAYDGEVAFTDRQLGDLVAAVDASPRAASTAIIVHGSQGEAFDEHGFFGHGRDLYEEVLRVPLVVALPGHSGTARYDERAVSTADIVPTVLELAGARRDEPAVGVSLVAATRGQPFSREPVYARADKRQAVVDWPYKLIRVDRKGKDRLLLFDLSSDPAERRDISEERGPELARLGALLDETFGPGRDR